MHTGDSDGVLGPWFQPDIDLTVVFYYGVNQCMKCLSLSVFHSLILNLKEGRKKGRERRREDERITDGQMDGWMERRKERKEEGR